MTSRPGQNVFNGNAMKMKNHQINWKKTLIPCITSTFEVLLCNALYFIFGQLKFKILNDPAGNLRSSLFEIVSNMEENVLRDQIKPFGDVVETFEMLLELGSYNRSSSSTFRET